MVSSQAIDKIAAILEPRPIEVRILGRRPEIEGLADDATPKIEAIIVYLAFHREVVSQRFREEFWPESTSRQAADNACLLYTSPSPRDRTRSRMPSSA